jgi:septum formation protein
MAASRIVLASRSPQRETILARLGLAFEVVPSTVAESAVGRPEDVVLGNALRKARSVYDALGDSDALVIGGDTVISLGGEVIGKPESAEQAADFLKRMSGRAHSVVGGLALVGPAGAEATAVTSTKVRFRDLNEDQIDRYVASGEWQDRSGAYAIQQGGSILVESIEGDYLNIIGLSVNDLVKLAPGLVQSGKP